MAEAQKGQEKVKDSPQGESSSPPLVGNTDTRISNHRKCWIYSPDVTVCGIYGPGTSQEIVANWSSPFENSTLGEMSQKVGGLIQAEKQMTSVTRFNTQQIWDNISRSKRAAFFRLIFIESTAFKRSSHG